MAFSLSVGEPGPPPAAGPVKWQQRPDMIHGVNIISTPDIDPPGLMNVADDWRCLDGSPVTDLHFWGSYPGWEKETPGPVSPPGAITDFRIRIYSDMPRITPDGMSHPRLLLYEEWVPASDFTETYIASIPRADGTFEHKFRYDLNLPRIFWQKQGDTYWLNIAARTLNDFPFRWGWENSMDRWDDFAVYGWYKTAGDWFWEVLKSPALTLTFDDLLLGAAYPVGSTFHTGATGVSILPFQNAGGWTSDNFAHVENAARAGGAGNEINTDNVNIGFVLPYPVTDVSWLFGEYGGNINLNINGIFKNIENYKEINGATIGGVQVSITNGAGNDAGSVALKGIVTNLSMGGQEHWVDNVRFSRYLDMAYELTTCQGPMKWLQFPDMAEGRNIMSVPDGRIAADDFLCVDGRPVTKVHFWGSYLNPRGHWEEKNPGPPVSAIPDPPPVSEFEFVFYQDVPAGTNPEVPYSHPGHIKLQMRTKKFTWKYWDSIPHTDASGRTWWEHKFYFIAELPEYFMQEKDQVYWLSIGAVMEDTANNWYWG